MSGIAAITGGASGIGRGTAKRLLDDGWTVVALDVSEQGLAALKQEFASYGAKLDTQVADVTSEASLAAAFEAVGKRHGRLNGFDRSGIGVVEISETCAAQAIALRDGLGLDEDVINPDGGALVRGHPLGAAGAVLVTRLFTRMARRRDAKSPRYGVATMGAIGGLGLAALFEGV